ncbi:hypothetical protein HC62_03375 [Acetobacter tropicalis]|uniref:Uncharacterized protein n=1 Tax=Acetobacter tropicalis TaxID=104102 RepID=A0A251ZXX5_9PROT|nr:hypothetical protein HC62_03375 [Acetobacter tropicalis]
MSELAVQAAIFPIFSVMRTGASVCRRGATPTSGSVMLSYLRAVMVIPWLDHSPVAALGAGTIGEGSG